MNEIEGSKDCQISFFNYENVDFNLIIFALCDLTRFKNLESISEKISLKLKLLALIPESNVSETSPIEKLGLIS